MGNERLNELREKAERCSPSFSLSSLFKDNEEGMISFEHVDLYIFIEQPSEMSSC